MIQNFLLKSLYRIESPGTLHGGLAEMINYYDYYREMQDLSIQSLQTNLQGDWQLIELTGVFDDLASAFIHTFMQTHKIWRQHAPCNILYVDPDVLCVRPVNLWEMMPPTAFLLEHHNCGVRFFGHQTLPTQWNTGYQMLQTWDYDNYSYEQFLYQAMHLAFTIGAPSPEPRFVHQYPQYEQGHDYFANLNDFNQYMIHPHASRNPELCVQQLKHIWNQVIAA